VGAALGLTRTDHTSGELRALSSKCPDSAQVRRLLALALVIDGRPRGEAAALAGMDRQTLCDWVHRYNASGVEGLKSRCPPGRVPALTEQQRADLWLHYQPDSALAIWFRERVGTLQGRIGQGA
jgi:Helix-turn-helix domain